MNLDTGPAGLYSPICLLDVLKPFAPAELEAFVGLVMEIFVTLRAAAVVK